MTNSESPRINYKTYKSGKAPLGLHAPIKDDDDNPIIRQIARTETGCAKDPWQYWVNAFSGNIIEYDATTEVYTEYFDTITVAQQQVGFFEPAIIVFGVFDNEACGFLLGKGWRIEVEMLKDDRSITRLQRTRFEEPGQPMYRIEGEKRKVVDQHSYWGDQWKDVPIKDGTVVREYLGDSSVKVDPVKDHEVREPWVTTPGLKKGPLNQKIISSDRSYNTQREPDVPNVKPSMYTEVNEYMIDGIPEGLNAIVAHKSRALQSTETQYREVLSTNLKMPARVVEKVLRYLEGNKLGYFTMTLATLETWANNFSENGGIPELFSSKCLYEYSKALDYKIGSTVLRRNLATRAKELDYKLPDTDDKNSQGRLMMTAKELRNVCAMLNIDSMTLLGLHRFNPANLPSQFVINTADIRSEKERLV